MYINYTFQNVTELEYNEIFKHQIYWGIIYFNKSYTLITVNTDIAGHSFHNTQADMGQVTKLWLSCYLVLLSIDSKTR